MKDDRLRWCLDHQDWTLEDWKNVIWSDETSVVLNQRRGGYRLWRTSSEALVKSCIRERWKGYSEFIFWGCFTYDQKGPCHCYIPETAQDKRKAQQRIDELNDELEPLLRAEWELNTAMARVGLRNTSGPKPLWRWDQKHGKLVRSKNGGIDWWRYQSCVLIPKLFPFTKRCLEDRPKTIVQEDRAPAYTHEVQARIYKLYDIQRLLWCGNSPDLNAIEPAWFWLKRKTTNKGAPKNRLQAIEVWEKAWEELPQAKIQAWIERIPFHIQEIIKLEGGNEYKEGKKHLERSHE